MANKNSTKYKQVRGYLGSNYTPSDDELILLYCQTLEDYEMMRKELRKAGFMVSHTNKFGAANLVKNPLAIEITKTTQTLNALLKSMGLTASQRKKVSTGGGVDDDGFEEF